MRDRPTAPDLLDTARSVLKERLLPALPKDLTYDALMILNAMGIAQRQCAAGQAPEEAARERLRTLYNDASETPLADLEHRLAADIRTGRFDPGADGASAVYAHLRASTCAKAAESAPKALKGREP